MRPISKKNWLYGWWLGLAALVHGWNTLREKEWRRLTYACVASPPNAQEKGLSTLNFAHVSLASFRVRWSILHQNVAWKIEKPCVLSCKLWTLKAPQNLRCKNEHSSQCWCEVDRAPKSSALLMRRRENWTYSDILEPVLYQFCVPGRWYQLIHSFIYSFVASWALQNKARVQLVWVNFASLLIRRWLDS